MNMNSFRKELCVCLTAVLCLSPLMPGERAKAEEDASAQASQLIREAVPSGTIDGINTGIDTINYSGIDYEGIDYESILPTEDSTKLSGTAGADVPLAAGVSQEMCKASYWYNKSLTSGIPADRTLLSTDEIRKLNQEMLAADGANMNDLENMRGTYDADDLKSSLAKSITAPTRDIYADQVLLTDKEAFYGELSKAVSETGFTGKSRENLYAVAVHRTIISSLPTAAYIGYSATDKDDEKVSSAINVNEPFVIRQKAVVADQTYYWGYANNCTGWVNADCLAICADKDEWLDAYQVDPADQDFLVVTQNQITLEPSLRTPELSEVKLTFATVLKLVPEDALPASVNDGERGLWNNYVVYLPTRAADGSYVRRCALISQHYQVSIGFAPLTQQNLLDVAFRNLGDRYGWGGMVDSMDCSLYTRNVYKCFGLEIPRNTTWQQTIPGRKIDLSEMTDDEKLAAMSRMPAGTLFYFPGHTMIYTGTADYAGTGTTDEPVGKMAYVISDTGSLSDTTGDLQVKSMYSIILNPLTTRRANGKTWLTNVTTAILPISEENFALVKNNIDNTVTEEVLIKVPAAEGQRYASSKDTLPVECFLGKTTSMYLSFYHVKDVEPSALRVTVIKGSKLITKAPVRKVTCDSKVASAKIDKTNSLATLVMKKSGSVTFEMADGEPYTVDFTVETPKAQTKAVKNLLASEETADIVSLDIKDLFGTQLDGGELTILSQKAETASVSDNVLTLTKGVKNTVKLRYQYLNKKYSISIQIK